MSLFRGVNSFRILLGLLGTVCIVAYLGGFSGSPDLTTAMMASRGAATTIDGLAVSLKQSNTSPPTITVTVTNKNSGPVTILSYESPLDPIALKLGLLKITPDGDSQPLRLSTVQVRRIWPPSPSALIGIAPGESEENVIELDESIVPLDKLGSKALVQLKGNWMGVWSQEREEVAKSSLDNMSTNPDVATGAFVSNDLTITIG